MNDDKNNDNNWLNDLKPGKKEPENQTSNNQDDYLDRLQSSYEAANRRPETSEPVQQFEQDRQFQDREFGETENYNSQFLGDENIDNFANQGLYDNSFVPQKNLLEPSKTKTSLLKPIIGAVILGAVISGLYIGFSNNQGIVEEVVTVKQTSPLKEVPVDPKGMEIENLDKNLFDVLENESEGDKVERLLPISEKPIITKKQVDTAKSNKETNTPTGADDYGIEIQQPKKVKPQPKPVKKVKLKKVYKPKKQKLKKKQPNKQKSNKQVTPKVLGAWKVQLASVGSAEAATASYKKLTAKIPLIANYKLSVEKAKVKGKDFHRVQIIGFKDKAEATKTCEVIKSKGSDCFVKK